MPMNLLKFDRLIRFLIHFPVSFEKPIGNDLRKMTSSQEMWCTNLKDIVVNKHKITDNIESVR